MKTIKGYYFITDAGMSRAGNENDVRAAVAAGVRIVQYRNKNGSTLEMYREALCLKQICKNICFIINDRVDIALAVNADGVHIGREDMPFSIAREILGKEKIIGVTVGAITEALEAAGNGADYLGVSPIFATGTKSDAGKPVGLELLREIRSEIKLPIVAIGGIDLSNAKEVINTGADSICAISAVVTTEDVAGEIAMFQELFGPKL